MTTTSAAAALLCAGLFGLGVLQLLLVAGVPIGHLAWGGNNRVLSGSFRVASLVSTLVYAVFAVVVLEKAGLVSLLAYPAADLGIWVLAGLLLLGAIPNLISGSVPERQVMAPLALLLSVLSVVVALG